MLLLTSEPLWLLGLLLVGLTSVIACLGPRLVRRFVALEKLTTNNEVAGFKFATVGVLYAVLLAFAIILVGRNIRMPMERSRKRRVPQQRCIISRPA